jgi:hypothetical protein
VQILKSDSDISKEKKMKQDKNESEVQEDQTSYDKQAGEGEGTRQNKRQTVAELDAELELEEVPNNPTHAQRQQLLKGAIAFVHFDAPSTKSNMIEALVHHDKLTDIDRGRYVRIVCIGDNKEYTGRIVEGPFFDPDALKRDSTPVEFIVMNQSVGKVPLLPDYHGRIVVEILGEERNGALLGAVRRPHPGSPIKPYDTTMMQNMLNLRGEICLGYLDNYEETLVYLDEKDKGVIPRNLLTVGTIGSGKSNTNQVFIEETLANGFAQIVLDPEGEYIFMDQPAEDKDAQLTKELKPFKRKPTGIKNITVYRPPHTTSNRRDTKEFSVPFDSLSAEMIIELIEMSPAQQSRFMLLYDQAVRCLRKINSSNATQFTEEDFDISHGYPGIKLASLISILDQEITYYEEKKKKPSGRETPQKGKKTPSADIEANIQEIEETPKKTYYFQRCEVEPLMKDHNDETSYPALRRKLRGLHRTGIFDKQGSPPLNIAQLCRPGHLSIIDMSDCGNQQIVNIIIADLLTRVYRHKIKMSETENEKNKVIITLEEAHGFVSRERQNQMTQTLDQLRRIARRGRKRWLCLHFVTQSPQHLPAELFELANNKIIHQMTGSENLRVLKAAAGMINEAIWDEVPSLGRGRAVIVSGQYPHPIIARIRRAASKRNFQH